MKKKNGGVSLKRFGWRKKSLVKEEWLIRTIIIMDYWQHITSFTVLLKGHRSLSFMLYSLLHSNMVEPLQIHHHSELSHTDQNLGWPFIIFNVEFKRSNQAVLVGK